MTQLSVREHLERREIKKAEVLIAKALRTPLSPSERAALLVLRARTRLLRARPDDALDDLTSAQALVADILDEADGLELLGDCYFARFELASVGFADRSNTQQALRYYRRLLEFHPDYDNLGWIHFQLGRVLLTDNHADEAADHFHAALLAPSHVAALTAYAYERLAFIAFYESRDSNKALAFINKAIDTYPASEDRRWLVQVHLLRSRIYRDQRRLDQALRAAEAALGLAGVTNSDDRVAQAEALLTAGELLSQIEGRDRDVIGHLQQFLQISRKPLGVDVTWSRVHEMLGDAYFRTAQYALAVSAYQAALQYNPYHPWEVSLHYRTARSHYQQGEYERAVAAIQKMLQAAQGEGQVVNDYRVYDVLGNAQFALGRYNDALQSYQTALQLAPPNADNLDKIRTYHDFAQELSRT